MAKKKHRSDPEKRELQLEEQETENENSRLLSSLPLDPEVVSKGDIGDMSLLNNRDHPNTRAFNKIVDEIVKMHTAMKIPACEPKVSRASLS
jgi:hypothetical protein